METEKIEFWTYTSKDGMAQIWFDKQTKYIEISEKDLHGMMNFVKMDKETYVPRKY